jgi:predicted RNase H-related nuclease YkuK (DUF458 family)
VKKFKLFGGVEVEDLGLYLRDYYKRYPRIKIYVGTDSMQGGRYTKYVTSIGLLHPEYKDENGQYHGGGGVHVIFRRDNVPRIREIFPRLWKETEFSLETAELVHEALKDMWTKPLNNKKVPIIHLDFSAQPRYKSNQAHDASIGYIKGYGFEVHCKPDSWCASYLSDWLCR